MSNPHKRAAHREPAPDKPGRNSPTQDDLTQDGPEDSKAGAAPAKGSSDVGGRPPSAGRARRRLAAGLTIALVGVAWSAGSEETWPGYLTLLGTLWTLWGLHQLGRSGSDRLLFEESWENG